MRVRCVAFASVCSVFLAASAAVSGAAFAAPSDPNLDQATQAYQALMSGDQDLAIANYTVAIESQKLPKDALANALLNRGLAHQQLNEHQAAIDDYTAALRLDAMDAGLRSTALYNRGLAHEKMGSATAAIEDFTSALLLNPEFAMAYASRGNALRDSGQYLFALSDYDRALRYKHPDPARVHYAQALSYEKLKRPAEMKKSLHLATQVNPPYAPAAKKLAELGEEAPGQAKPDPVLASLAPVGGEMTVRKPDLPKAVEPPVALMVEPAAAAPQVAALVPKVKKYQDRVPTEDAPMRPFASKPVKPEAPEIEPATASIEPASETQDVPHAALETRPVADVSGWTVQVVSAASENAALSTWNKIKSRRNVSMDRAPVVLKAELGKKGTVYRVRFAGYDNQKSAQASCSKLKSKGVSCFVSRM
jgi:tetratricopeptide (TPR) repeat protein